MVEAGVKDPVEDHPVGVEGILQAGGIQLGLGHQRGHRGVDLGHRTQLLSGEVTGHQGVAGGAVLPHPHGQHVEGLGGGELPGGQGGPEHSVGGDGHQGPVPRQVQLLHGPQEGVGHQLPQGVPRLDPGSRRVQGEAAGGEHLVIGQAVPAQIGGVHLPLPLVHQGGDLPVLGQGLVDGDQTVVRQGLLPARRPGQGDGPQVLAVGPGGDNIGVSGHNGLGQGGVAVARDDQVDPLHRLGQLLVLGELFLFVGSAVGQADDKLGPLGLQGIHAPLGALGRVGQGEAGGGGVGVGLLPHQAEDAVGHPTPLQEHILPHPGGGHGPADVQCVRIVWGGGVVGHEQGGQPVAAGDGGGEHVGKAGPLVVELVVAGGGGVIAHGPHGAQLGGLGGVQRLDQGADGEIPSVQGQGVRVLGPLPLQGGHQPGVPPRLSPLPVALGQEVGVQVVGKEHRGGIGLAGGPRRQSQQGAQRQGQQGKPRQSAPQPHGDRLLSYGFHRIRSHWTGR